MIRKTKILFSLNDSDETKGKEKEGQQKITETGNHSSLLQGHDLSHSGFLGQFLSLLGLDSLLLCSIIFNCVFLNSKAGQLSGEGFPVFGMAHSEDNGVEA